LSNKGIAQHNQDAFEFVRDRYHRHCEIFGRAVPIVLDSCCGTGRSTRIIAGHRPDSFVIGMDKSAPRLERNRVYREHGGAANSNMV
jgi:tRNA G46 methylase TrmB